MLLKQDSRLLFHSYFGTGYTPHSVLSDNYILAPLLVLPKLSLAFLSISTNVLGECS
jgi:hypothetical protein